MAIPIRGLQGAPLEPGLVSAQPTHRSAPRRKHQARRVREGTHHTVALAQIHTVLCPGAKRVSTVRERIHTGQEAQVPLASRALSYVPSWLHDAVVVASGVPGRTSGIVLSAKTTRQGAHGPIFPAVTKALKERCHRAWTLPSSCSITAFP